MTTTAAFGSEFPDEISFTQLQNLLNSAKPEVQEETEVKSGDELRWAGKTEREIDEIAQRHINLALDEVSTPLVHKAIVLRIIQIFGDWHVNMAEAAAKDGEHELAGFINRDLGVLNAAHEMIRSVSVEENDFTISDNSD